MDSTSVTIFVNDSIRGLNQLDWFGFISFSLISDFYNSVVHFSKIFKNNPQSSEIED